MSPKSNKIAIIVGVVVVVVVIIVAATFLAARPSNSSNDNSPGNGAVTVPVTVVNIAFTGSTSCWSSATGGGGTLSGGQHYTVTDTLFYNASLFGPGSCSVNTVSVATAGFTLVSDNAPVTVPSHGSRTLSITVAVPTTTYTGVLTIDATTTSS
jgi:hypothetical protein